MLTITGACTESITELVQGVRAPAPWVGAEEVHHLGLSSSQAGGVTAAQHEEEPGLMFTHGEDVEAHALRKRGWSYSAIARHLGRDRPPAAREGTASPLRGLFPSVSSSGPSQCAGMPPSGTIPMT